MKIDCLNITNVSVPFSVVAGVLSIVILCGGGDVFCFQESTDKTRKETVFNMYCDYQKKFPGVKEMSPREALMKIKKNNLLFIDVRSPEETEVSMILGAVTKETFLQQVERNKNSFDNKTLITYCTIGYRSGIFAGKMAQKNITIYNLQAGILGWVLEGGIVIDKNGKTNRIHVYGPKWNHLPEDYDAVW